MTAPRETGAEGREAVRLIRSALYRLAEIDAGPNDDFRREWRRICTHYDDILERALATPRPVEVTEGMVEAGYNCESAVCEDVPRYLVRDILTAALRAQPAGGTEITIPKDISAERLEVLLTWKQEVESYGYTVPVVTPHPDLFVARLIAFATALRPAPVADAGGTPDEE